MLRLLIQLGLLCCLVRPVVLAMEELEWDVQVAPTTVAPRPVQQLWRSWVGQLRQVLQHWQPSTTSTTPHPRLQLRSTTPQAELLQPYGALNPMFQVDF